MRRAIPEMSEDSIVESVHALIEAGFVEDAGAAIPEELSEAEVRHYATNIRYFAWVDVAPRPSPYELQRRLKRASVTVIGLGGTGSAMASSLVAAGVGMLRGVDCDVIESNNLTRQLLYTADDVGEPKVDTAVRRLRRLNPHVRVEGRSSRIGSPHDVVSLCDGTDFVVLCADDPFPDIALWTSEAALRTGIPWMMCLYAGPTAVFGIFVPRQTPCFQCALLGFPAMLRDRSAQGAQWLLEPAANAVIAPSANLSGHFGALEAVNHLTGLPTSTRGRIFHQNLMHYDHNYYTDVAFAPDCPACGGQPAPDPDANDAMPRAASVR